MKQRVQSVDALRGFIMIIMALDHVRDYFHADTMIFSPEDLTRTTTVLFFTRWITHLCAPLFMFTAGLGAYFWLQRGHTKNELTRFLWTRGLWLVFLDVTVSRFAMTFGLREGLVVLNVLWALGWSMVALGVLVHLPVRVLTVVSVAGIALHNLLDGIKADRFGSAGWIWNVLHQLGLVMVGGVPVLIAYPLVPWIFVMAAGFCFGRVFELESRRTWMLRLGLALTAAFVVIRTLNVYGDPVPWTGGVLSFLRCSKYPPSLDYLLMAIGPGLLILGLFDGIEWKRANPLMVFGRVPLFYFLGHLFVLHLLTIPFALVRYGRAGFLLHPLPRMGGDAKLYPPDFGYSLLTVYGVWILVVLLMYPLSRWFAGVKDRRKAWWLSYV